MSESRLTIDWADEDAAPPSPLGVVRFDVNERAIIPFTDEYSPVKLHYLDDPAVGSYVHCNAGLGVDCVLCRAGRTAETRALLPVYLPASRAVGVLALSPSVRPGALRPQLMPPLRSGKRVVLLVSKPDRATFKVSCLPLTDDMDDGAEVIAAFEARFDAGEVNLRSVYPTLDNDVLAGIPSVAAMLRIKGVG